MTLDSLFGVFGAPLPELAAVPSNAMQFSPIMPDAAALEDATPETLTGMVMAAAPGTVERRYGLALALRALKPRAPFTAMAAKDKGGSRIAKELENFGCVVEAASRRHQRVCHTTRPAAFAAEAQAALDTAIIAGGPQIVEALGLWSQPGVFSWDRIDPGSGLLLSVLPPLAGRGADLGCGIGVLACAVLKAQAVTHLDLLDIDRRAVAAARKNVADERAAFHWMDVRNFTGAHGLDFVVMNPPFHDGGVEDRALGQTFVRQSQRLLRDGGTAWLVANRHLPYESLLSSAFTQVTQRAAQDGYKVYEAIK